MAAQHDMVSKFGAAAIVVMLMLVVPNSGSGEDAGHDKDQLAPRSSEAEFGFSLPIVHGRPPAPGMDDEKFVTPFILLKWRLAALWSGHSATNARIVTFAMCHHMEDPNLEHSRKRFDYQAKFRMVFGCAHQENIVLTAVKECTGILGLGMGDASFLRQTGITKFSYCAPPRMPGYSYRRDSWLRFGSHAQISGKKVPLVMRWGKYYLPLTAITYKYNELMSPVPIIAYKSQEDYLHMMVDTGTSLLSLPTSLHDDLIKEMEAIIKSPNIMEGATRWPRHCYERTMDEVEDITVTLSFDGGLDIELFTSALFVKTETINGSAVCLAVNRVDDSSKAILRMFAQTNINVGYDLLSREIAMDPIRCA
uniref:Peptidase A1 domain-containing protein n=1 Tax=Oryza glumipatula TaxID=40148 RepID=A0A0E0AS79_9ORYZ